MDTSEIYIKMSDCPEIQLKRKIKLGDYMALRGTDVTAVCIHRGLLCRMDGININDPQTEWIKLFRQGQIQEMMIEKNRIADLKNQFNAFVSVVSWHNGDGTYTDRRNENFKYESYEQLWLAFYIYRKHSKIWDGEKWEKK